MRKDSLLSGLPIGLHLALMTFLGTKDGLLLALLTFQTLMGAFSLAFWSSFGTNIFLRYPRYFIIDIIFNLKP